MSRHAERREQLLDKVADHLLVAGIAGSSLRPLAEAVGLSDRMLLYYFKDKEDVIAGGLARVAERLTVRGPGAPPVYQRNASGWHQLACVASYAFGHRHC